MVGAVVATVVASVVATPEVVLAVEVPSVAGTVVRVGDAAGSSSCSSSTVAPAASNTSATKPMIAAGLTLRRAGRSHSWSCWIGTSVEIGSNTARSALTVASDATSAGGTVVVGAVVAGVVASEGVVGVPHDPQKWAPVSTGWPHWPQKLTADAA